MQTNESTLLDIPRTSEDSWRSAQRGELEIWKNNERRSFKGKLWRRFCLALGIWKPLDGDDDNKWWAAQFDNYTALPTELNNVLEVGCGPYTNMRLVLDGRSAKHVHCSDPLAGHYVQFEDRWLARQHRAGKIFVDNHPLEECPFADNYFDLTVCINVLDHVRDAILCLEQCIRVTKPGGYFVFGQELTGPDEIPENTEGSIHPIALHHETIDAVLFPALDKSGRRILARDEGRVPHAHYGTYLYLGRKL